MERDNWYLKPKAKALAFHTTYWLFLFSLLFYFIMQHVLNKFFNGSLWCVAHPVRQPSRNLTRARIRKISYKGFISLESKKKLSWNNIHALCIKYTVDSTGSSTLHFLVNECLRKVLGRVRWRGPMVAPSDTVEEWIVDRRIVTATAKHAPRPLAPLLLKQLVLIKSLIVPMNTTR